MFKALNFKILCLILLILTGCETEREKNIRLSKTLTGLIAKEDKINLDIKKLKKEQAKSRQSTVKERFAYLYSIKKYAGENLEEQEYIKTIQLIKEKQNKYKLIAEISPKHDNIADNFSEKYKKLFTIYIYNKQGLLLDSWTFKPILKINKGSISVKNINLKLEEEPFYFRIENFM